MAITRRRALGALAAAGATTVLPKRLAAREVRRPSPDAVGVLYDPTRCIGCKRCIRGCAEANGCDPEAATADTARLTTRSLTVLERYDRGEVATCRKVQCMHCVDPACVSACMLGAMRKNDDGSVTWNGDLCVGCRYCEIACPFNIPRFEWDTPLPELVKCELCPDRRARGLPPACVERCRRGALVYGRREDLLAEARYRIGAHPERYNPEIYGEHDGGGTSVLYMAKAGVSFADMGLPDLGTESVPSLPEMIQHTLYKGFVAPLALFGIFAAAVRRNSRRLHAHVDPREHRSEPVGGRILTWPFAILATFFAVGAAVIVWRFAAGLGATTNLSDGYPMGLWIAFDVVTGTALACGGYAVALLVYLLNRGRYHPLVRAAIVTSALGYTLGGLSVLIDIGRAWNFYKIPLFVWEWNLDSILLEVALCIMLYTTVLWIEVSPAILEGWRESRVRGLRRLALAASPKLERAMPWLIALGLLLPTMHQSSLGSLMLMAGSKLHPLWHTPMLPLLFLISCVAMGYAAVTLEATLSSRVFGRPSEAPMLRALAGPVAVVLLTYAVVRVTDLALRGRLDLVAQLDFPALLFLAEMALFVLPALGLLIRRRTAGAGFLAGVGVTVILAGALYRFSTYLIAFDPGPAWSYFPSAAEFAVTLGLVSAELMGYVILVKRFPVLRGAPAPAAGPDGDGAGRDDDPAPADVAEPFHEAEVPALPVFASAGPATTFGALLLLAWGGAASPLRAQTAGHVDLSCLTDQPDQCLAEPVPPDEPHDAVCATCHDLWSQATLAEAAGTCATADCHGDVRTLTPFHRTLHAGVINACLTCHRPHDARIPGGGENCLFCHRGGGLPGGGRDDAAVAREGAVTAGRTEAAPPVERPATDGVRFAHTRHADLECTACHDSGERHRRFVVDELDDCRACHHAPTAVSDCAACHEGGGDDPSGTRQMVRTLELRVGSLDQPVRLLPFRHVTHETVECVACHTEGSRLGARDTDCTACHDDHHRPTATCVTCHAPPAAGAHGVEAHLGCGGSGCHRRIPAPALTVPRTRSVCLACHRDLSEHRIGRECVDCHVLPPPRSPGDPGVAPSPWVAPRGMGTVPGTPGP